MCENKAKARTSSQVVIADAVKQQWAKGGKLRKELLAIMVEFAGDKDCQGKTFKKNGLPYCSLILYNYNGFFGSGLKGGLIQV